MLRQRIYIKLVLMLFVNRNVSKTDNCDAQRRNEKTNIPEKKKHRHTSGVYPNRVFLLRGPVTSGFHLRHLTRDDLTKLETMWHFVNQASWL